MKKLQEIKRKNLTAFRRTLIYTLIVFVIGNWFFFECASAFYLEYRLISYASVAAGVVYECDETPEDNSRICRYFFNPTDGKTVEAFETNQSVTNNLLNEKLPVSVMVQYLEFSPEINQIARNSVDVSGVLINKSRAAISFLACLFSFYCFVQIGMRERRNFQLFLKNAVS